MPSSPHLTKALLRKKLTEGQRTRLLLAQAGEIERLQAIIAAQEAFIVAIVLGESDFIDRNGEIVRAIGVVGYDHVELSPNGH